MCCDHTPSLYAHKE